MSQSHKIQSIQIPNITPIRFILASLVMLFHIPQFSQKRGLPFFNDFAIFDKGTEAVYIFFALSGFLIIKQLYDEKRATSSIDLKGFYRRRALRIFPLYYLILIFGFLYYHYILKLFGFEFENNYNLASGILLSATFFSNIFSTYSPGGILEILWSIGIEEQFYFLIAPAMLLLPFKRIVPFLMFFTIAYFLLFYSNFALFLDKYSMLFFYFSFSGICAIMLEKVLFQTVLKKLKYLILVVFILYFTSSVFKENLSPVLYNLLSMILFGLTISVLSIKPIAILQNRVMNYLGKISYGIYMYHAIVMQLIGLFYLKFFVKIHLSDTIDIIIINLAIIGITILVSHLSYRYYESFFLGYQRKR